MTRFGRIPTLFLAAVWLLSASSAPAAGLFPDPNNKGDSKEPIEIVADRLVTNNTEKWADFSGSVKVTQGKFTMTSDALRIYYEGDLMNLSQEKPPKDVLRKLVATGRVHIVTGEYTADAERAEYEPPTEILTLSGENSRVVSGKNTLTGSKIVFYRAEGKASVEGSGTERVKAVFHQEEKGSGKAGAGKKEIKKDLNPN
jgi:lipopolysaccharide transport protein LptA